MSQFHEGHRCTAEERAAYHAAGWWGERTLAEHVLDHAEHRGDQAAYLTEGGAVTWQALAEGALGLAGALVDAGVRAGDRIGVWLPDGPALHAAFLAVELAGGVIVGLGARAGDRELGHVLAASEATVLITAERVGGRRAADAVAGLRRSGAAIRHLQISPAVEDLHPILDGRGIPARSLTDEERHARRRGPDDLFLINSTSGTTGLPKCVLHTQNRWRYFHLKATANGHLRGDDVFFGAVPAPFGFGLWTSHVTPITLGAPTVLLERFSPAAAVELIERHRVTVLSCVSTQFIMLLAEGDLDRHDLSSLRVMFTGGEAVPTARVREFERRTGAVALQFYGSNETGLLSGTTLHDDAEVRLRTAGRIVPEMQVRLFDEAGRDVTATGRGRPGCRGPALSLGYLDRAANAELYTDDGWMLMGDICEIDGDGNLTVVGRTSDFIIRGGKNISAPQVEADVATHPAVAHVAAVAMPDPVFGERVCAYVELVAGRSLDLAGLVGHLAERGISKELFPERLVVVDELPRSSGAKVAKGELRDDIRRRLAAEAHLGGRAPTSTSTSPAAGATA